MSDSGYNPADIDHIPACPAGMRANPVRKKQDAMPDVPHNASNHVNVFEAQIFGIKTAFSSPVVPAYGQVFTFSSPGPVVKHRGRRILDLISGFEQPESEIIILG